jgi:glycosyltransferase involved in cell wall biosynthesis
MTAPEPSSPSALDAAAPVRAEWPRAPGPAVGAPAPERPLHIALLGYRSNPHSGGQGIYIRHLARALHALGHRVTVVSGPPYPELTAGIELVRLPSLDLYAQPDHIRALRPRHLRSFTDTWEWFSMATGGFAEPYTFGRRLVRWMREHGHAFDVIHDNQSLCWGLLELQRLGLPGRRDHPPSDPARPGDRPRRMLRTGGTAC